MNEHFFYGFANELVKHAGILDWLFGKKKQPPKTKATEIKYTPPKKKSSLPFLKAPIMGAGSRRRRKALRREGVFGI